MPTALIAGLPQSMIPRVKNILHGCALPAGWTIKFAAGSNAKRASVGCDGLEDIVGHMSSTESPHIMALTESRNERNEVERRLTPHFRLRWLPSEPFVRQSQDIVALIQDAILEEDKWRIRVLPRDEKHVLVLPHIFDSSCKDGGLTIWQRATRWGDEGLIRAAERLIARFEGIHQKKGKVCHDARGLAWNHAGQRHGDIPIPRNWKFSLKLPESFHFDVAYPSPKEYSINDALGRRHTASKGPLHHLNIDAHGYVR